MLTHPEGPSLSLELHYGLEGTSQRVTALDPAQLWSRRRPIDCAGTLGAAIMSRFSDLKWAARDTTPGSRVVNFTRTGEKRFAALFPHDEH